MVEEKVVVGRNGFIPYHVVEYDYSLNVREGHPMVSLFNYFINSIKYAVTLSYSKTSVQ